MTTQEFAQLKIFIEGAYNNFQVSSLVWYELLKDFDFEMCLEAVKNVIKVSKYPLTIAAITEEYNSLIKKKLGLEISYLLDVVYEMEEKRVISYKKFCEIEYQINYTELTKDNKNMLYAYKKDKKVLDILKGWDKNEIKLLS